MTSLERQLATQFAIEIRRRGEDLLDNVAFVAGWDGDFPCDATVRDGDATHEVCIDPDEPAAGWCSCSDFTISGPCAHMWATVRATELVTRSPELLNSLHADGERPADTTENSDRERPSESSRRLDDLVSRTRRGPTTEVAPFSAAVRQVHFLLAQTGERQARGNPTCAIVPIIRTRKADGNWGAPERITNWGIDSLTAQPNDDAITPTAMRWLAVLDRYVENRFEDFPSAALPVAEASPFAIETAQERRLFTTSRRNPRGLSHEDAIPVATSAPGELGVWVELELAEVSERAVALQLALKHLGHESPEIGADDVQAVVGDHIVIQNTLTPWDSAASFDLVTELLLLGPVVVDRSRVTDLQQIVHDATLMPTPADAPRASVRLDPSILDLESKSSNPGDPRAVAAELEFRYRGEREGETGRVAADSVAASVTIGNARHRRAVQVERATIETFLTAGGGVVQHSPSPGVHATTRPALALPSTDAAERVRALLLAGFDVSAGDEPIRMAPAPTIRVASGIDWFELEATVEGLDGEVVAVPELLRPSTEGRRNSRHQLVRLGAGDIILVDAEREDLESLRGIGQASGDGKLRLPREQAFVLDGLLRERLGEVELDSAFRTIREQATRGLTPTPEDAPTGFGATLRPYQRDALGWFAFLRSLGVGGCLADDMGLGKTVQVLALLEQRRTSADRKGPSLVVAPRSLLFHWEREADKFAPDLRVAAFAGAQRATRLGAELDQNFTGLDLILTTYGTLRNDVERLAEIDWDYVILDEAHAIKNENSQASRAVRACRARHRLALSGTPVENHLGELWALFEFLNPGMLGASRTFRRLVRDASERTPMLAQSSDDPEDSQSTAAQNFASGLRAAVRPFLLRRTKEQVLDELPPKSIQVLDCELSPSQRTAYDELAAHYRARLLGQIDEGSIPDALRFQVLEALLRLRQAACHPALVDATRADEDCGKFDVLWPMLDDLREQGHKALLFSQFPSFLALLRSRLDERGMQHAYLDGSTHDRRAQVDRFEQDPDCGLFLISIKAGGHGLNLTAASYVFLLDPWWNPAVEAQAIDRAHRMGQRKSVHAYRLLCRDTVEERVAELQDRKRKIAEAVLGDDRSVLQELRAADVALLLT